ncbi:hypothetical protein [Leeuwenhoekiella sp. H156]|uniref:hypothetical protein n=1 Tax=Leeuwenhoekiella sp. H156 TaxID=3450128 RepID=UPI003FA4AB0F
MKINFFCLALLLLFYSGFAQSKDELRVRDFFWGANDIHSNTLEIPEKWKNESAVVLFKNENYDFNKSGMNINYTTSTRKRIKLLDKNAVLRFSEFTFDDLFTSPTKAYIYFVPVTIKAKRKKGYYVGIKVIKQDGTEIVIDFENESVQQDEETKIAISNLEVGDIIDYYIYKEEPFRSKIAYGFDPVESILSDEYPIVDYKLFFETENDFFINFNSFNGAPKLKEIKTEKNNTRRYSLEASDIEKYDSKNWFYPLVELPTYKFQVFFARSGRYEETAMAFLPEKENIIKNNVSQDEVLKLYDERFKPSYKIKSVDRFLEDKNITNDTEKVTAAYYYLRHYYLTRYVEAYYIREAGIMNYPFGYYNFSPLDLDDQKEFIIRFGKFLKDEKIPYEIVVAKKRFDGSIDDLLIEQNVNVVLKINLPNPLFLEYFGPYTSVNEISPFLEGTDIYTLSASKNNLDRIEKSKLPTSSYLDNESRKEITFSLDNNLSEATVNIKSRHKGHQKNDQFYGKLIYTDYVYEDYEKYQTESFIELLSKKTRAEYEPKIEALKTQLEEKRLEGLQKLTESEFGIDKIEDYVFEIQETGRYGFDSYFSYEESFKVKDAFVKKAGPNHIVELGKLITDQIDLTEKDRERTENIYMTYPRSYFYKITFKIPAGYEVAGLEKFNINVDNTTGSFVSEAVLKGDEIELSVNKNYKHNYEPNSNWPLMVEFLDAANQFTNEKMLLKKL